jgi:hypothetical protein
VSISATRWHPKEAQDDSSIRLNPGVADLYGSDFLGSASFPRGIYRVRLRRMWIQRFGQASVRRIGGGNSARDRGLSDRAQAKELASAYFGFRLA